MRPLTPRARRIDRAETKVDYARINEALAQGQSASIQERAARRVQDADTALARERRRRWWWQR